MERQPLRWHYGPTPTDPEPVKMWHYDCGGEVWWISDDAGGGGYSCALCGASDDES